LGDAPADEVGAIAHRLEPDDLARECTLHQHDPAVIRPGERDAARNHPFRPYLHDAISAGTLRDFASCGPCVSTSWASPKRSCAWRTFRVPSRAPARCGFAWRPPRSTFRTCCSAG